MTAQEENLRKNMTKVNFPVKTRLGKKGIAIGVNGFLTLVKFENGDEKWISTETLTKIETKNN